MSIEQKDQNRSSGAPILLPSQKLWLNGIESRGGQGTLGLLTAVRVSPKRGTFSEDLVPPSDRENAHPHFLEREIQGTQVMPPYQKLRLKSVEPRGDKTSGLLVAVGVAPQKDTSLEDLMPLLHKWKDQNYYSQMDTFDCSEIPVSSLQPLEDVQDGATRWKILVVLVAILVISLIGIGIFSAYLLRPVFLHSLHIFVH